jgi:hypothetical protein
LRLVAGGWFVLREKYCWLVADKPSEQAASPFGRRVGAVDRRPDTRRGTWSPAALGFSFPCT